MEKELVDGDAKLAERAQKRLGEKLGLMVKALPAVALPDLRKVRIFLMYGEKASRGGRKSGLEYFQRTAPKHHAWLDPRMGSSVVIFSAMNYVSLSDLWALKALVHEFGHAHHLEHWPEKRADILDTWRHAMDAGLYQVVREEDKKAHVPNYAARNQLEYFAELTAMYFARGNYFPYDRAGLREYDPDGYWMVRKVWGVEDPE